MWELVPLKQGYKVFFFGEDMLPLACEPLWFLETSITEVARGGACASKSCMQDALPSDRLPGGLREVTLKCMCGGADTDRERKNERKTELGTEAREKRRQEREEQLKDEREQASEGRV